MKIKIIKIDEDINEEGFEKYIIEEGYNCKKLKLTNCGWISKKLNRKVIFEKGIPDFFIWNKKEMYFCEFKSKNDSWRISQISWAIKNNDLPIALALVDTFEKNKDDENVELQIDTDLEEDMKVINISHRITDIYWKEYAEKHPNEIGTNFTIHYDKNGEEFFLGYVPIEVSKKRKEFDEIYFKDKYKQDKIIRAYERNNIKNSKDIHLLL